MKFRLLPLLLLSSACDPDHAYLSLPARDADIRALIAVFERDTGIELWAADVSSAGVQPILGPDRDGLRRVSVLYYSHTLSELDVPTGPLLLASRDDCGHRPLPRADRVYSTTLDEDPPGFAEQAEAPSSVTQLLRAVACPCVALEQVAAFPVEPDNVQFSVSRGHEVIVGTNGRVLAVDATPAIVFTGSSTLSLVGGYAAPDGTVWAGSLDGHAFRSADGRHYSRIDPAWTRASSNWWAGAAAGNPTEVYALSQDGELVRFDGSSTRTLLDRAGPGGAQKGSLVWVQPGEVFGTVEDGLGNFHVQNAGDADMERWDSEFGELSGVFAADADHIYAGTLSGHWFVREGASWTELTSDDGGGLETAIYALAAFGGGFIAVGSSGYVVQYHPDAGFCRSKRFGAATNFRAIVPLADMFVLTGIPVDQPSPPPTSILVLRPGAPK